MTGGGSSFSVSVTNGKYYIIQTGSSVSQINNNFTGCEIIKYGGYSSSLAATIAIVRATSSTITSKKNIYALVSAY